LFKGTRNRPLAAFFKSRYNNELIVKLVSIFVDVEEEEEKKEESFALMQATS
jgi:hypothetical protein